MTDTIFALSSGAPPAAIAIVRISGPGADAALQALAGFLPEPRHARLASLSREGLLLDRALVVRFPGPNSATGEDVVELHLHGGRAVVAAVQTALSEIPDLRAAHPGEFTRRAFEHGRIDLAEAEGLADLLQAETESQRRSALALVGGALSRKVEAWRKSLLSLAAQVEAELDFADESDVVPNQVRFDDEVSALIVDLGEWLTQPAAERLRDGIRTVVAGPPNAGKSTLINALAKREVAITSDLPGTTRDLVEAPTSLGGTPFLLVDTAGLRVSQDRIEAIGVELAERSLATADLVIWLGAPADCGDRTRTLVVQAKADILPIAQGCDIAVSAKTGAGMDVLVTKMIERAAALLPRENEIALHRRHRDILVHVLENIIEMRACSDALIKAELLRQARVLLDRITGRAGVEDVLDMLFGRFCIGK